MSAPERLSSALEGRRLVLALDRRADELAVAMESRCYHGGEGRTRMNALRMARRDYLAFLAGAIVLGGMIAMNIYGI